MSDTTLPGLSIPISFDMSGLKLDGLKQQLSGVSSLLSDVKQRLGDVTHVFADVKKGLQDTNRSFNALSKSALKAGTSLGTAAKEGKQFNETLHNGQIVEAINKGFGDLNKTLGKLDGSVGKLNANLVKSRGQIEMTGHSMRGAIIMGNLMASAMQGVGGILAGAFQRTLNITARTEESLNVLRAQTGANDDEFKQLAATARQLGSDLSLPGTNSAIAAQAMTELSRAGLSLQDSMNGARGVLLMMDATQTDGATAARSVAAGLNMYGMAGIEATHVANIYAAATLNGVKSLGSLNDGLRSFGPTAKEYNIDLATSVTLLAEVSKAGLQGAFGGTALRSSWERLAGGGPKIAAILKALNVQIYDNNGKMRDARSIIDDLGHAESRHTEAERNRMNAVLFGQKAQGAMNIVLADGAKKFDEIHRKISDGDAATKLAAAHMDGFAGSMRGLNTSVDSFLEKYGSRFIGFLSGVVKTGGDAIGILDGLITKEDEAASHGGALKPGEGPLGYLPDNIKDLEEYMHRTNENLAFDNSPTGHAAKALEDVSTFKAARPTGPKDVGVFIDDDTRTRLSSRLPQGTKIPPMMMPYELNNYLDSATKPAQKEIDDYLASQKAARAKAKTDAATAAAAAKAKKKPQPPPSGTGDPDLDKLLFGDAKEKKDRDADERLKSHQEATKIDAKAALEDAQNSFDGLLKWYETNAEQLTDVQVKKVTAELKKRNERVANRQKDVADDDLKAVKPNDKEKGDATYRAARQQRGTDFSNRSDQIVAATKARETAITQAQKDAADQAVQIAKDKADTLARMSKELRAAITRDEGGTFAEERAQLDIKVAEFRAAGVQEVDIARFVASEKKRIDDEEAQHTLETTLRIGDYMVKTGQVSTEAYINELQTRLAAQEKYSDAWFSLQDKINEQVRDAAAIEKDAVDAGNESREQAIANLTTLQNSLEKSSEAYRELGKVIAELQKQIAADAAKDAKSITKEVNEAAKQASENLRQLFAGVSDDIGKAADRAIDRWRGFRDFFKSLEKDLQASAGSIAKTLIKNTILQGVGAQKSDGGATLGNVGTILGSLFGGSRSQSTSAAVGGALQTGGSWLGMSASAGGANAAAGAPGGAADSGGGSGGMGSAALSLGGLLGKGGSLAGKLGGFGGGLAGALPWVGGGLLLNSLLGDPLRKIFRFDKGGILPTGMPSIVAERGTGGEVIVPRSPSMALPVSLLRALRGGSGGGGAGGQHFHIYASAGMSTQDLARQVGWTVRKQLATATGEMY